MARQDTGFAARFSHGQRVTVVTRDEQNRIMGTVDHWDSSIGLALIEACTTDYEGYRVPIGDICVPWAAIRYVSNLVSEPEPRPAYDPDNPSNW